MRLARAPRPSRRDDQGGQAMIETALLMPFIFLLILMVIEMGFLLWMNLNVGQAAREAARSAAVGDAVGGANCKTEPNTVKGRAFAAAVGRIKCGEVSVVYVDHDPTGPPSVRRGDGVIVRIQHPYASLTGFFHLIGVSSPDVSACADARLEVPPLVAGDIVDLDEDDATCVPTPAAKPTP